MWGQVGAAFVFAGGAPFAPLLSGLHWGVQEQAAWRAEGAEHFGRLGASAAVADWDGDGTAELVLGAPRATVGLPATSAAGSRGGRHGGRAAQEAATVEMPGAVYVYAVAF